MMVLEEKSGCQRAQTDSSGSLDHLTDQQANITVPSVTLLAWLKTHNRLLFSKALHQLIGKGMRFRYGQNNILTLTSNWPVVPGT